MTSIGLPNGVRAKLTIPQPPSLRVAVPQVPNFLVMPVRGPQGLRGQAGDGGFTHTQLLPAGTWTITNTLGRFPASISVWIGDIEVDTDVEAPDVNTIVITFGSPQSGRAEII